MEMLNHADGAHGALNKLMVSASLVHLQPQDNSSVKIEANGFPIADSPVRQRVDATRKTQGSDPGFDWKKLLLGVSEGVASAMFPSIVRLAKDYKKIKSAGGMQEGGSVKKIVSSEVRRGGDRAEYDMEYMPSGKVKARGLFPMPAELTGGEGGDRWYLGEGEARNRNFAKNRALSRAQFKMASTPADSIPQSMIEGYFDGSNGYQNGGEVEESSEPVLQKGLGNRLKRFLAERQLKKFGEQDPQFKAWYGQDMSPGSEKKDINVRGEIYDVQEALGNKVLQDQSSYLGRETYGEEGSPYQGASFVDVQEGGPKKGREAQYLETDKGRYSLGETHYGGLLDPVRNLFSEIPRKVDSGEDFSYQEGGEVGKYEKALQKAEIMGEAGYALPESLSAPAEEMSNMRSPEDLYGTYMRGGPEMAKHRMSGMESRALDSLLQQKMNNMGKSAVPHYQNGGEVKLQQVGVPPVDKFQQMAEMWEDTGRGVESARAEQLRMAKFPADNYSGEEVQKSMYALMPYLRSFGRLKTPLQERNEFLYNRLNVDPNNPPSSLQGLKGSALLQRLGNEGI
jgi:hypothetical protein